MKLKVLAFGSLLLMASVSPSLAQDFKLGLEAGANFSNFIGSDLASIGNPNSSKLGFVGGAFLCLNFGKSFGIRPEILYEQKGAAVSGTSTTTELDYIEVPVLLKFSLGTPVVNPAVLVGPSFNWNTVAQAAGNNISGINSSDVGIMGGIEVDIEKFLLFNARYELGLDNVQTNTKVQNGVITVLVGYSFI